MKNFWLDLKQELSGITGKTFYKTSLLALQMQAIQRYWVLISSSGKHLRFLQFIANRERSLQMAKNSAIFSESCQFPEYGLGWNSMEATVKTCRQNNFQPQGF